MVQMNRVRGITAAVAAWILIVTAFLPQPAAASIEEPALHHQAASASLQHETDHPSTWIAKWTKDADPKFWEETELVANKTNLQVQLVRPKPGIDVTDWVHRWSGHADMRYLHPNQQVQLLASPNDEYTTAQNYLTQIRAHAGWDIRTSASNVTIALIDTGVDLTHPDLKDNLVPGVNLVRSHAEPQDDHGHGTNVAGVIAAAGNNGIGVTGIAWKAKIMPIKALEADGLGDEDKLGEAIQYAVDNGANIVVMSLGLHRYSPFLQEIVDYAEQKGVLLISAAGNEGREIQYPAAYPTVMAVGGVALNNRVMLESNYGPEIDLVAPWEVFTTALGGDYEYNQGTSMAAPQVAGVAALAWSQYPNMKPYEIRNLLKQTAQDIEAPGWDMQSGYGLLRMDRALKETYRVDKHEPNNRQADAKQLPLDTMISGELTKGTDTDWFYVEPMYPGTVKLTMLPAAAPSPQLPVVNMLYHPSDGSKSVLYEDVLRQPPTLSLKLGKGWIAIQYANRTKEKDTVLPYKLRTEFTIYRDYFEDNDRQFKAYSIPSGVTSLTGTFHQVNDQDWFSIQVRETGSLQLSVTPNTMRMDVAVLIQKTGEKATILDEFGEGKAEMLTGYDVTPGRYYILISNVIADQAQPVRGEYVLNLNVVPKLIDPNEPNDRLFQATRMVLDTEYEGLFDTASDQDWFSFTITEDSYVSIQLKEIPGDRLMLMTLYDARQTQLQLNMNTVGEIRLGMENILKKGTYYLKLGTNKSFSHRLYKVIVKAETLSAGFRDIKGHWAEKEIAQLVKDNLINGYGDYTFRPNRSVTRAEAVMMIVKTFGLKGTTTVNYSDVRTDHWAREAIRTATANGIVSGYSDGRFRPDQPITRAEMAAMLGQAMELEEANVRTRPFQDVRADHWAAGWIAQLSRQKVITGYDDGTFKPDGIASRAELTVMLIRAREK